MSDALHHDGPARVERVDQNVCLRAFMSGVNRVRYPTDMGAAATALSTDIAFAPKAASEPPLRCYVFRHGCR